MFAPPVYLLVFVIHLCPYLHLYLSSHLSFVHVYAYSAVHICLALICVCLAYLACLFTPTHASPLSVVCTSSHLHRSCHLCWLSFILSVIPPAATPTPTVATTGAGAAPTYLGCAYSLCPICVL